MTATVHRLEPYTMAVIFSTDADPGFQVKLCNEASLFETVHGGMFMRGADEQSRQETVGIVATLRESGSVDFEDGWIKLCVGMADVVALLVEKASEAKQEQRYADQQRFNELKEREEWQIKYEVLRAVLVEALGPRGPEIAAVVD